MLNDYGFGGYLIFGRAAVHRRPGGTVWRHDAGLYASSGRRSAAVETTLERYDIAWTIFAPDSRVVAALDREPGWRRLYADATAVVQVRDTASGSCGV